MAENALNRKTVIAELAKSPHGSLDEYVTVGLRASGEDPEFYAHLIAWNAGHGQVRDAKIALPVLALKTAQDAAHVENALAQLARLDPRSFVKAADFARKTKVRGRMIRRLVTRYLREKESVLGAWEQAAIQHRDSMKRLYALFHVPPMEYADRNLFGGSKARPGKTVDEGSRFGVVRRLASLSPLAAANAIVEHRIPFLIAAGALGAKMKDPDVVMALIKRMSPTELVTNMKMLEGLGVKDHPALRAALEEALQRAGEAKTPKATLKTTRAAEALEQAGETKLSGKLRALQERQLDKLGGIDGNWLVLGDKSGSMASSIIAARMVAATLARKVKGQVHLVFFDTMPYYLDATGLSYETLVEQTQRVSANGGTSIGCGLQYMLDRRLQVDGIAIVTDGGENSAPYFPTVYQRYAKTFDIEPTVYVYRLSGDRDSLTPALELAKVDAQAFPLGASIDYYSVAALVDTMRVARYSLVDEVMETPLATLDAVLPHTKDLAVLRAA